MILMNDELRRRGPEFLGAQGGLHIGVSSIDVSIQGVATKERREYITHDPEDGMPPSYNKETFDKRNGLLLGPGEFVLLKTKEFFYPVPDDVVGMFTLRSIYARAGLDQATSQFIRPGWSGHLVLEVRNNNAYTVLRLKEGAYIGQVHFFQGSM